MHLNQTNKNMKKYIYTLLITALTVLSISCDKEDDDYSATIRIETSGNTYSYSIRDEETAQKIFLEKKDQIGAVTATVTVNEHVTFNYQNTGTFTYKIYVNDVLKVENTRGSGSGGQVIP